MLTSTLAKIGKFVSKPVGADGGPRFDRYAHLRRANTFLNRKTELRSEFFDAVNADTRENLERDKGTFQRIWADNVKFTLSEIPVYNNPTEQVFLKDIKVAEQFTGQGDEFITWIKSLADQFNVEVYVLPAANFTMDGEKLAEWYKRNGFENLSQTQDLPNWNKGFLKYTPNQHTGGPV